LVLEIWFLINPTKKTYAKLCRNNVRRPLAQYICASASQIWHSIHIPPVAVSKEPHTKLR